jgi:hypothetical protein
MTRNVFSGPSRWFEERCPNGCFLIRKRTLREVPVNGRFWPKPAIGARASLMTPRGQNATLSEPAESDCFWGLSGHRMSAF